MTREEYQSNLQLAYLLLHQINNLPLEEMLASISKAEALAPLLSPTLFQNNSKAMFEDKSVLNALLQAKKANIPI